MINIAVIGAGRMGQLHARNFNERTHEGQVVAIVDYVEERASELAKEVEAEVYTDVDEVLSRDTVDAICISTPVKTHKPLILKALNNNKHVFCEKPLTLTVEDAEEIVKKVDVSDSCFLLAFMTRFNTDYILAKEKIEAGAIGTPVFIRSTGRDPGLPPVPGWGSNPEECGGISFELCSHDYDRMRWLMNDEIKEVYARAGILSSQQVAAECNGQMINDSLVVSIEFNNGALGSVDGLLNIKYGYDARVEVVGDEGVILIGDNKHTNVIHGKNDKTMTFSAAPSFIDRFSQAYIREAQHFIDCIKGEDKPEVTAKDGLEAVKIAATVNKSIQIGQPVSIGGTDNV